MEIRERAEIIVFLNPSISDEGAGVKEDSKAKESGMG